MTLFMNSLRRVLQIRKSIKTAKIVGLFIKNIFFDDLVSSSEYVVVLHVE